jgi:hypothetical protein
MSAAAPPTVNAPPADPAPVAASAPLPPPEPQKVTIPSGVPLAVRLVDAIDSATAQTGDTFHATLEQPVAVDGDLVIPAHYDVDGHVVNAQASGKFAGRALLELQLDRIKVGDRWYNMRPTTSNKKLARGERIPRRKLAGAAGEDPGLFSPAANGRLS